MSSDKEGKIIEAEFLDVDLGAGPQAQNFIDKLGRYYCTDRQLSTNQYKAAILHVPASMEELFAKMRKIHKGNAVRDMAKAKKHGYFCDQFIYANYTPDIFDINTSKTVRQGRPMKGEYYFRKVDPPTKRKKLYPERCTTDYGIYIGAFLPEEGRKQGDITVDRHLCGYIYLKRYNEIALFSTIIGHGAHLKYGIMYLLYEHILSKVTANTDELFAGIKYIMYGGWQQGKAGLQMWKKRTLFQPYYLNVA